MDELRTVVTVADGVEMYKLVYMNILSNNCAAGDIYKRVLHQPYENPFIWTLFQPVDFIDFIDKYNQVNFYNIRMENNDPDLGNHFEIILDNVYRIKHIHMVFDPLYDTPTVFNDIDVHYNRIWEYIYTKYMTRLKRINKTETPKIVFLDSDFSSKRVIDLPYICERHNYPALIFTPNRQVVSISSKHINTVYVDLDIPFNPISVIRTYENAIKEFLKDAETI